MDVSPTRTTNANSSPRDHDADSNHELSRKKQRLQDSTTGSPDQSTPVEVCDPEDIGTDLSSAIMIEDDLFAMAPYSHTFDFWPHIGKPRDQVLHLQSILEREGGIDWDHLATLSTWLADHVIETQGEGANWTRHYLDDESDFFASFGRLCLYLLDHSQPLLASPETHSWRTCQHLHTLIDGLGILSSRIIPALPSTLESTLTRRDSVHPSASAQSSGLMIYIALAARVTSPATPAMAHYDANSRFDANDAASQPRCHILTKPVIEAVARMLRMLSQASREVKDAWMIVASAIAVIHLAAMESPTLETDLAAEVEDALGVVTSIIIPTIRDKHPRALPDRFHENLFFFGQSVLRRHIMSHDSKSAFELYELFIKSDSDGLLTEAVKREEAFATLLTDCGRDLAELADVLSSSWYLQQAFFFINSGVMDVRTIGLLACNDLLQQKFEHKRATWQGMDHPSIQYAVRFLRQNEVVKYIFGAESRAAIIRNSQDIVCFLAATRTYTGFETDIIWHAGSTSVEADFVKATFEVLEALLNHLDFDQLLRVLDKYAETPINRLGFVAIEYLRKLYIGLAKRINGPSDIARQLSVAEVTIKLLKEIQQERPSALVLQLHQVAITDLARLSHPDCPSEARIEICKQFMPVITDTSEDATFAFEVLHLFLGRLIDAEEKSELLAMLPVGTAVDELCRFIDRRRADFNQCVMQNVLIRLRLIVRLIALSDSTLDSVIREKLFAYVIGDAALCNHSRDDAWDVLFSFPPNEGFAAVRDLAQIYLQEFVPQLSPAAATPRLVHALQANLKGDWSHDKAETDPTQMLESSSWKTLLRIAQGSPEAVVVTAATMAISELLFPREPVEDPSEGSVTRCQTSFTRDLIESLNRQFENLGKGDRDEALNVLFRGLDLLDTMLSRSLKQAVANAPRKTFGSIDLISSTMTEENSISFQLQIYGMKKDPMQVAVNALDSTQLVELLDKLSSMTGARKHRLLVGGKEVAENAESTLLTENGISQSCVVLVSPRFEFSLETDAIFTDRDAMQQQIVEQYDVLEGFLDGPDEFAAKVLPFLLKFPAPDQVRCRLASNAATATAVLPPGNQSRSTFSLTVLMSCLKESARQGLADPAFVLNGVRLLTSYFLDESRPLHSTLHYQVAMSLFAFLSERPADYQHLTYFAESSRLALRLLDLLSDVLQLPRGQRHESAARTQVAIALYEVLVESFHLDSRLWDTFVESNRMPVLLRKLLLDADMEFSYHVARSMFRVVDGVSAMPTAAHVYWTSLFPAVSEALALGDASYYYFDFVSSILNRDSVICGDEAQVREIVGSLSQQLWAYRHSESSTLVIADRAMAGLLRLLSTALGILKSFKRPLDLDGLATKVLRRLLFPDCDDLTTPPLVYKGTRDIAYDLVKQCFDTNDELDDLLETTGAATRTITKDLETQLQERTSWIRSSTMCAGLVNLGMTCYMNSLLQQLFANIPFRKFLLDLPVEQPPRDEFLCQLQLVFARMQNSISAATDTTELALQLNIQVGNQEDVHGFYAILLARLEDAMPDAESKATLAGMFSGQFITQIRGECGHVSSRTEPFSDLSITVKNKVSLHDSLNEFVQGEPLEGANKYKCVTCLPESGGRLVNALRRTCLEVVPPTLTFCLKRFTFDFGLDGGENKVNDRFDFPGEIDMSKFTRAHLENPKTPPTPDIFELVGVIVHQGSLTFGHYWSYVRLPNAHRPEEHAWVCLEDTNARLCPGGLREVQEQCFGGNYERGNERVDNAYVLFYHRRSYISQAREAIVHSQHRTLPGEFNPPRMDLPESLLSSIHEENVRRQRVDFLFDSHFASLVDILMNSCAKKLDVQAVHDQDELLLGTSLPAEGVPIDSFTDRIVELTFDTLSKIMPCDAFVDDRIFEFAHSFDKLLTASPAFGVLILQKFGADNLTFQAIIGHQSSRFRDYVTNLLEMCLRAIKVHLPDDYPQVLATIIASHASLLEPPLDGKFEHWEDYFRLVGFIASQGQFETGLVLGACYLDWVFRVMNWRSRKPIQRPHVDLVNWLRKNSPNHSPLFDFLHTLFSSHMDLSDLEGDQVCTRGETDSGWHLTKTQAQSLFYRMPLDPQPPVLSLYGMAVLHCPVDGPWETYAPGQFLGLLARNENVQVFRHLEESMKSRFEHEEDHLDPLLATTLHVCANRDDDDVGSILKALARNLPQWNNSEMKSLIFLRDAYKLAPNSTIATVPSWSIEFLTVPKRDVRFETVKWLQSYLFRRDNAALDCNRVHSTRILLVRCIKELETAYRAEKPSMRYRAMLDVAKDGGMYLEKATADFNTKDSGGEDEDEVTARKMDIELSEAASVLKQLGDIWHTLDGWTGVQALPTRLAHDIDESEGPETTEEDEEELSDTV